MKFRTPLAAAAAVMMLAGLAACGGNNKDAASPPAATTTTTDTSTGTSAGSAMITMKNLAFSPTDLTVAPGTEIMIMNADDARHNLTDNKTIKSGDIEGGANGMVKAPAKAGDYPFKCTYHFGMEGTLHVK